MARKVNRLNELRERDGISLQKLSNILKEQYGITVSSSQLMYYEKGERQPRNEEIWQKLAEYFGVPVTYLLGYSESKPKPLSLLQKAFDSIIEFYSEGIDDNEQSDLSSYEQESDELFSSAKKEYDNLQLEGTLIELDEFITFYIMDLKEPLKELLINFAKSPKENQDAVLSLLRSTAQNSNDNSTLK